MFVVGEVGLQKEGILFQNSIMIKMKMIMMIMIMIMMIMIVGKGGHDEGSNFIFDHSIKYNIIIKS